MVKQLILFHKTGKVEKIGLQDALFGNKLAEYDPGTYFWSENHWAAFMANKIFASRNEDMLQKLIKNLPPNKSPDLGVAEILLAFYKRKLRDRSDLRGIMLIFKFMKENVPKETMQIVGF